MPSPAARPVPSLALPERPSLVWLRKRAKRLRRDADSGDPEAVALLATHAPGDAPVTLARAQRALGRAHGFAGWAELRDHVAVREQLSRLVAGHADDDEPADAFLRAAVLSYSEPDRARDAVRMLEAEPTLATASVWTLAACGRRDELARRLEQEPALVSAQGGPHGWVPLLYLCYARIPQDDAVGTLRVLLGHGADPDAGFLWHGLPSPFTALPGVLGGGERDEPAHPDAVRLAGLLLDAGADPNDNQAFYNRAFSPDDSHLPLLLSHGAGHERPSPWRDRLGEAYPSAAQMLGEHLRAAASHGFTDRVRLLVEAGVDPDSRGYHPAYGEATAYEVAVRHGQVEAARLLREAGADGAGLDADDLALAEAFSGRRPADPPAGLAHRHPDAVRLAAERHGTDALEALLAIGYDVSTPGRWATTALHEAALRGDEPLCRWLLTRGADRTATDGRFEATPAGWAEHAGHRELAALLTPPQTGVRRSASQA